MHFTDPDIGLLGENAIVGAGVPIAVGAAMTAQLDKTGQVAITFFGDGAINQGVVHEAMNLAAIWDLPIIFFCENNLYSEMTPISAMVNVDKLADHAVAFGMRAVTVDGYDPIAVYEITRTAVERARSGRGPTFIEAMTYRLFGHMVGDTEPYRTKEEVETWRQRDSIKVFPQRLINEFGFTEADIEAVRTEVEAELVEISRFALESPWPEISNIAKDVFA